MRKLLLLTYNAIFILISSLMTGCNQSLQYQDFYPKTYDEYYTSLENTTIQIELVINNKRAICYYTNDSQFYVYTIKHQYSNEYGYIYNTLTNELYCIENQVITEKKLNKEAEDSIIGLYNTSNIMFHLNYDFSKFEYINTVTICNRECDKYRFEDKINNELATFNIYIDKETGFCLKGVAVINNTTVIYFETKKFIQEPNTNHYIEELNKYNNKNTQ